MINQAKPKFNIFWLYGCIALLIIGFSILGSSGETVRVTWPEVESQMIEKGRVERAVVVNDKEVEITLKDKAVEQLRKEDKYRNIPDRGPQFSASYMAGSAFLTATPALMRSYSDTRPTSNFCLTLP